MIAIWLRKYHKIKKIPKFIELKKVAIIKGSNAILSSLLYFLSVGIHLSVLNYSINDNRYKGQTRNHRCMYMSKTLDICVYSSLDFVLYLSYRECSFNFDLWLTIERVNKHLKSYMSHS